MRDRALVFGVVRPVWRAIGSAESQFVFARELGFESDANTNRRQSRSLGIGGRLGRLVNTSASVSLRLRSVAAIVSASCKACSGNGPGQSEFP